MGNCSSQSEEGDTVVMKEKRIYVLFCLLCKEHLNSDKFLTLDDCSHSFCKGCLRDWLSNMEGNPDTFNSICPSNSLTPGNCNGIMAKSKLKAKLIDWVIEWLSDRLMLWWVQTFPHTNSNKHKHTHNMSTSRDHVCISRRHNDFKCKLEEPRDEKMWPYYATLLYCFIHTSWPLRWVCYYSIRKNYPDTFPPKVI